MCFSNVPLGLGECRCWQLWEGGQHAVRLCPLDLAIVSQHMGLKWAPSRNGLGAVSGGDLDRRY